MNIIHYLGMQSWLYCNKCQPPVENICCLFINRALASSLSPPDSRCLNLRCTSVSDNPEFPQHSSGCKLCADAYRDLSPDWNPWPYLGLLKAHSINRKYIRAARQQPQPKQEAEDRGRKKSAASQWERKIHWVPWSEMLRQDLPAHRHKGKETGQTVRQTRQGRKRKKNASNV